MKALILAGLLLAALPAAAQAHACYFFGGVWVCDNLPRFMDPNPPRYDPRYDDRGYYERRRHEGWERHHERNWERR